MNEIKFRAWDNHSKYYFIPSSIDFEKKRVHEIRGQDFEGGNLYRKHMFKSVVLEQYTSLKDKNGKEIFEGDIVKVDNGYDTIGEVFYTEGSWEIGRKSSLEFPFFYKISKIIGNIHENPEICNG